ncbi:MAG: hypothetical protein J6T74_08170 [Clostridia bacterium]|nr:hypothetical protein [Clostridia bacterium]
MTKNEIIEVIKQFVEGQLPIKQFEQYAKNDGDFRAFLKLESWRGCGGEYPNYLEFVDHENWNSINGQLNVFVRFDRLISDYDKNVQPTFYYIQRAQELGDIYPDWLSDDASEWVDKNIVDKVPENLNESQKKKWIKQKIKETFKYVKKPPEWAQSGEWPQDEDGNFLTFVRQTEDGDLVTYTFRNDKTKEEVEVEEYY